MKPICVPCQRFFRCKKNDFRFIEAMPIESSVAEAVPGNAYPDHWTPYKVWSGDRWECEGCGASIVVGVATKPLSEHYWADFESHAKWSELQVNDC